MVSEGRSKRFSLSRVTDVLMNTFSKSSKACRTILPISAQIAEPVFSIIESSKILQFIWQRAARVNFENYD
jgi:hypothetical protein